MMIIEIWFDNDLLFATAIFPTDREGIANACEDIPGVCGDVHSICGDVHHSR
jgi:hypothetical protein